MNKCMYTQKSPLVYQALHPAGSFHFYFILLARLDGFDQASSLGKFLYSPASKHQGAKPKSNWFNPTNHREKRIYEFCTSKTEFLRPTNLAVFVGRMCPVCVPICLHVLVCQVHIDLGWLDLSYSLRLLVTMDVIMSFRWTSVVNLVGMARLLGL